MMSNADPAGTPLAKKLGIAGECVFHVRRAPASLRADLGDLGDAVWQQSLLAPLDLVIAFHTVRSALVTEWPKLAAAMGPEGGIWVALPKPGSDMPSELTEDLVRNSLGKLGWDDDKACGIDDTWLALRFAKRPVRLRPKDAAKSGIKGDQKHSSKRR